MPPGSGTDPHERWPVAEAGDLGDESGPVQEFKARTIVSGMAVKRFEARLKQKTSWPEEWLRVTQLLNVKM